MVDETLPHGSGRRINGLTQKMHNFVLAYVQCGNGLEAYRKAYSTRGTDMTANSEVRKLLKRPEIIDAIKALRAELQERAEVTAADVLRELWDNSQKAKAARPVVDKKGDIVGFTADYAASNTALVALGKHLGLFDKKDGSGADNPLEHLTAAQRRALREALEKERERRRAAAAAQPSGLDGSGASSTLQ